MCTTYFVNHGAPVVVAFTPTATLPRISHHSHHSRIKSQQNQQHYWNNIHPYSCQIAQQPPPPPQQKRRRSGSSIIVPVSAFSQMETFDNSTFISVDDTITSESINNDDTVTTEFRNNNIDSDGDGDDYDEMVILQKVNGRYVATTAEDHQHMSKQEQLPKKPPTIDRNSNNRDPLQSQQYPNSNVYNNNASGLDRNAEYRYSVKDWLPIMCSIFQSSTLKYTRGPIIAVMMWSLLLCTLQQFSSLYINYLHRNNSILQQIYIFTTSIFPSTTIAHATTVTVLGLLLVFRTTSAYQKFDEGRLIWERILSISRNMTRQIYLYPEFYQVRSRILQLLAAYPYFLHQHVVKKTPTTAPSTTTPNISPVDSSNIRHRNPKWWRKLFLQLKTKQPKPQTSTSRKTSPTTSDSSSRPQQIRTRRKVISNELPWSLFLQPDNAFYNRKIIQQLMYVENRPLYICDEIGKEIISVPYSHTYTSMERMVLLQLLNELTEAVSECERINHTSVPLNYARHSLRGLTIWLFTLPVSLLPTYDWWTAPIMGLTAWLYYGIYQIGYIVEDPFQRTIRLTTICDTIYRDVICTEQRTSAFDDMILSGDVDGEWKDLPL